MPKTSNDTTNWSVAEVDKILQFLDEGASKIRKFCTLMKGLRGIGFEEKDNFKVGLFLSNLLQEPALFPGTNQRMAALFILYDMYRKFPLASNPFAFLFNDFLHLPRSDDSEGKGDASRASTKHRITCQEQYFLYNLVTSSLSNEVTSKTPNCFTKGEGSKNFHSRFDISNFQLPLVREHSQRSVLSKSNITNILPTHIDPNGSDLTKEDRHAIIRQIFTKTGPEIVTKSWKPEFIRPIPPLLRCSRGEVMWMNPQPDGSGDFMWDLNMNTDNMKLDKKCAEAIINKACSKQLTDSEISTLKLLLKVRPSLATCSSKQLFRIAETDIKCAFVIVDSAMSAGCKDKFLPALTKIKYGIHSFRAIHKLIIKHNLPTVFSHLYISLCMEELHNEKPGSKQDALVEAMASLLSDMIKNDHDVKAILLEIGTFCMAFHKNKSVCSLWRIVRIKSSRKTNGI